MGKCIKYLIMTLNIGVFVAGGVLFVAGLLLKLETGLLNVNVVKLWNKIQYNGAYLGTVADLATLWMIIFGGMMMSIAFLGWFGTWKKIRTCLYTYVILLIILICAEGTMVALWVALRGRGTQWLKGQMLRLLRSYNGPGYTDEVSDGWNHLFVYTRCCGVAAQYENGGTHNDFSEQSSPWYTANRISSGNGEDIPATCCQGVTMNNYANYINSDTCTATSGNPTNFYVLGCYEKTVAVIKSYSLIIMITIGLVFLIQVVAILATCMRLDRTKPPKMDSHPPPGPPPYVSIDAVLKKKFRRK